MEKRSSPTLDQGILGMWYEVSLPFSCLIWVEMQVAPLLIVPSPMGLRLNVSLWLC